MFGGMLVKIKEMFAKTFFVILKYKKISIPVLTLSGAIIVGGVSYRICSSLASHNTNEIKNEKHVAKKDMKNNDEVVLDEQELDEQEQIVSEEAINKKTHDDKKESSLLKKEDKKEKEDQNKDAAEKDAKKEGKKQTKQESKKEIDVKQENSAEVYAKKAKEGQKELYDSYIKNLKYLKEVDKQTFDYDILRRENELKQERIKVQELENAVHAAEQIRIKVYREGEGFVYGQDIYAINKAKKNLDNERVVEQGMEQELELKKKQRDTKLQEYDRRIQEYENKKNSL